MFFSVCLPPACYNRFQPDKNASHTRLTLNCPWFQGTAQGPPGLAESRLRSGGLRRLQVAAGSTEHCTAPARGCREASHGLPLGLQAGAASIPATRGASRRRSWPLSPVPRAGLAGLDPSHTIPASPVPTDTPPPALPPCTPSRMPKP